MRLLDYRRYEAELGDNYVWFEAPLRDRPPAPVPAPVPAAGAPDARARRGRHPVWRYVFIYPNTAIDLYPDQVMTWQIRPRRRARTSDSFMAYRPARPGCATASSSG